MVEMVLVACADSHLLCVGAHSTLQQTALQRLPALCYSMKAFVMDTMWRVSSACCLLAWVAHKHGRPCTQTSSPSSPNSLPSAAEMVRLVRWRWLETTACWIPWEHAPQGA